VAAIIRFEHPPEDRDLSRLIDLLIDWLAEQPKLKRTSAIGIRALVRRRSKNILIIPEIRGLKEPRMTPAEKN
jgi:hypothetical protein